MWIQHLGFGSYVIYIIVVAARQVPVGTFYQFRVSRTGPSLLRRGTES